MKSLIKQEVNRFVESIGLEIRRRVHAIPLTPFNFLETMLERVRSTEKMIHIVQIGANDGLHGDPIHNFLIQNKKFTKALLIEPQPDIIGYLKSTYAHHPNISIFNGAIGAEPKLLLYRIKPNLWSSFHAPWLIHAPHYRVPSGLTSANKELVMKAAGRYLDCHLSPENAIEKITVPCRRLKTLLSEMDFPMDIHLLQVDVEGEDDQVIYASDIDELQPTIINYESKLLSRIKRKKLHNYLSWHGYNLFHWNFSDTLAIQKQK